MCCAAKLCAVLCAAEKKTKECVKPSFLLLEAEQLTGECSFASSCVSSRYMRRAAFVNNVDKWHSLR